jgi:hypothetical protein
MKENNEPRVVLVGRDSTRLSRRRSGAFDSFTTVNFEERKPDAAVAYGTFWYTMSRRLL